MFWERFKYCNTKVGDRWHFSTSAIDAGLQKSSSASHVLHRSRVLIKSRTEKNLWKWAVLHKISFARLPFHRKTEFVYTLVACWPPFFLLFFFLSIKWVAKSKSGQLLIFAKYSHILRSLFLRSVRLLNSKNVQNLEFGFVLF